MRWIMKHTEIDDNKKYISLAIAKRSDTDSYYAYLPQILDGWQFKHLKENCYIATEFFSPTQEEMKIQKKEKN